MKLSLKVQSSTSSLYHYHGFKRARKRKAMNNFAPGFIWELIWILIYSVGKEHRHIFHILTSPAYLSSSWKFLWIKSRLVWILRRRFKGFSAPCPSLTEYSDRPLGLWVELHLRIKYNQPSIISSPLNHYMLIINPLLPSCIYLSHLNIPFPEARNWVWAGGNDTNGSQLELTQRTSREDLFFKIIDVLRCVGSHKKWCNSPIF